MIRAAALCLCLAAPAAHAGVAEDAAAAAAALQASVQALQEAESGKDRVAALTATIRAALPWLMILLAFLLLVTYVGVLKYMAEHPVKHAPTDLTTAELGKAGV